MSARVFTIPCYRCEEDGYIEDQVLARSYDEEPRYERKPCRACCGAGHLDVTAETADLVEAAEERLHRQIDAKDLELRLASATIRHQREEIVQAQAREHMLRRRIAELELAQERRAS